MSILLVTSVTAHHRRRIDLEDNAKVVAYSPCLLNQSFFYAAHGRRSVHHEDLVPNEYISNIGAFYTNWFTDYWHLMLADYLDTFHTFVQ